MNPRITLFFLFAATVLLLSACSAKISGTVRLLDAHMKPVVGESPKGTVVNMINITAKVEKASYSVLVDEEGKFESEKDAITAGTYKVEAARIGYDMETQTVEIGSSTRKKLEFALKKIPEGERKSIAGSSSDADKIINPGEVNIRPPGM
ncbi:MAG: carboxypeptidase regulatory-like domain-containing protein [Deltaproteobacteria bacterium]|nr:MAG: carboxypeptidase regulatory-like domain-containing protein [Deltaproteobacteria bacterium]